MLGLSIPKAGTIEPLSFVKYFLWPSLRWRAVRGLSAEAGETRSFDSAQYLNCIGVVPNYFHFEIYPCSHEKADSEAARAIYKRTWHYTRPYLSTDHSPGYSY